MSSDPIPDEELPPRRRFERLVQGPEPPVFRSIRPEEPAAEPIAGESDDGPEDDASILDRFEALKRTLGDEVNPDGGDQSDGQASDALQRRIASARQAHQEAEARREQEDAAPAPPTEEGGTEENVSWWSQRRARRKARKSRSFWAELPILIVVALVVAIVIKTFFFQAFYIPSGSMIPTLEINDRVLVNKLSYRFGAIERGDILVFDSPEAIEVDRSFPARVIRSIGEATGLTSPDTVLIKRVIALPGETVMVQENQVYVNGNPIAEPYLPDGTNMRDFDEVTVPADHVFMMGDNRNQSRDSRVFGAIPREDIVGRAFVTVWPPGAWGGL